MGKMILVTLLLMVKFTASAQTKVKITYDANGSRIKRKVVTTVCQLALLTNPTRANHYYETYENGILNYNGGGILL